MKKLTLLLLGSAVLAWNSRADGLAERYAEYGELIVTQMVTAPFPHPKRAEGHKYHEKLFTAKDSYSDNTVAVFIPKGFHQSGQVDLVVHFHGWGNHVESVLTQYKLIEQLAESGRNAVLVVPQGPRDASDSFGGKLEDPDGFKRFIAEVMATLREQSSLKGEEFSIGKIILSGHSGGFEVMSAIVDCGGLTDHVKEVWLFDALYAQTDKFLTWQTNQQGRLLNIYTEHGGTKGETEQCMATLRQRGVAYRFAGKDNTAKPADLQANEPIFLFTDLPHNDVLAKHETFRAFLETSCLARRDGQ
jgi:hypothetical protein